MATPTYSASVSGYVVGGVDGVFAGTGIKSTLVPDTSDNGNVPWTAGGKANMMRLGETILCKGPDGGLHHYRVVATNSDGNNFYLEFVGP